MKQINIGKCHFLTMVFVIFLLLRPAAFQESAPTGTWELIVNNAGIASMHSAVTRFNTVILLDRTNIGPSRINLPNGRCRENSEDLTLKHDCTAHSVMVNLNNNGVRPLFIQTDTWCSSGQFLADGTLLQTGGESEGNKKIRRIAPCPATGTCDWVEDANAVLTDGRWYASNQLLPDGRVIVVGGRDGFTYEFIPKRTGETSFPLEFLRDTNDPKQNDNYYPYLHLLPNGNLYIFANRDSIEFNYKTQTVIREFPRIPGEPRNYPSAGSSVLLPLEDSTDYQSAEVMICGGAQAGAFQQPSRQLPASQTCGRMVITSENPQWAMEEMPRRRCMGDMVLLPSGDVLLINGAGKGSQGFGFASDPVLNPVIYKPKVQSFDDLAATTIPRMYHSTANLLPDGRILVAGSNTHEYYTFNGSFPTELRIEAFSPPYLDQVSNPERLVMTTVPASIQHGETFSVVFTVGFEVKDVEVNLLSAPYTTHSFSQGQRLLRMRVGVPVRVGSNAYSVNVTAPPDGNIVPPAYYMLFTLIQGIPGEAAWVQVTN